MLGMQVSAANIGLFKSFKKEIAEYYKLSDENLLITPGSGEGLNLLARHFSDGNIVVANPTFGILQYSKENRNGSNRNPAYLR